MADEELTELAFIISRAGPMQFIWKDVAQGFNELVLGQKKLPGRAQLSLTLFDRDDELLYDGRKLEEVKPLTNEPYTLGGDNAFLDAVGKTIGYVTGRLDKTPAGKKPARVVVVIVTDGHDRISIEFTYKQIARLIAREREERGWIFLLAACDEDPPGMASALSIDADHAYHFEPTGTGILKLFRDLNEQITAFRTWQTT